MDDAVAKRRLLTYAAVRLACLGVFLFGLAVIYSDVARPGGAPRLGALLCIVGALAALGLPHALKKHWDRSES